MKQSCRRTFFIDNRHRFLSLFICFLVASHTGLAQLDSLLNQLRVLSSDTNKVNTYNELAYFHWNTDPLKGVDFGHKALKLSDSLGFKKGIAISYKTIGVCYWSMGSYASALNAFMSGLKIAEELDDKETLNRIEHNMALVHEDMGNSDQALYYFKKNIDWYTRTGQVYELPRIYNNIGTVYFQMNNLDSSLANYQRALTATDQGENVDEAKYIFINLSEVYFHKKDFSSAQAYLERSIKIYTEVGDKSGLVECYAMYGNLYRSRENYKEAQQNFDKALALAQEGGFTHFYSDLYKSKASIDSVKGNFKSAYGLYQKAVMWQDSLRNFRQKSEYDRLLVQYRTDQKEKENEILRQANVINQIKIEDNKRIMFIEAFASLLIIGLVVFFYYKRSQYQKKIEAAELQHKLREEKERIALDLHDNIGSQLTSLSLGITKFARDYHLEADHLNQNVSSTIRELRDTIWAINQEEITLEQLGDKINNLFWRLRQSSDKVEFELAIPPEQLTRKLKPIEAINIFRIIQEAVHNSYRHSGGTKISVGLQNGNQGLLSISVTDNGCGFDPRQNGKTDHYGLHNMKKRAQEIGCELVINSANNQGTKIELEVLLGRALSV